MEYGMLLESDVHQKHTKGWLCPPLLIKGTVELKLSPLSSLLFFSHFLTYFTHNIIMESPTRSQDLPTEGSIAPAMTSEKQSVTAISQQISQDHVQERWNSSTINIFRYLETLVAFVVMGINDASLGVSEHTRTR
jgi:hypothetical protein